MDSIVCVGYPHMIAANGIGILAHSFPKLRFMSKKTLIAAILTGGVLFAIMLLLFTWADPPKPKSISSTIQMGAMLVIFGFNVGAIAVLVSLPIVNRLSNGGDVLVGVISGGISVSVPWLLLLIYKVLLDWADFGFLFYPF